MKKYLKAQKKAQRKMIKKIARIPSFFTDSPEPARGIIWALYFGQNRCGARDLGPKTPGYSLKDSLARFAR